MPKVIQNKLRLKHEIFFSSALILSLILISSNSVSATTSNVDYNISVGSSLNLEISSSTVSMTLNPASKTFDTKNLGITVGTNYINGYNLYIDSSSTSLTNNEYSGTSYTIGTLADTTTTGNFPAGYWGYRISSGNTGDSSITDTSAQSDSTNYYKFIPNTLVSSSSTAINNNATTLTFATKIDYTKPAGTYTNTFTFSAIVNPVTYSITYADNTGDSTVANLPSPNPQTGMISGGSATLSSTVPTRDGYTFKSWCQGIVSNSGTTCTGTEYSAGGSFPISSTVGPEVSATLTAVWSFATTYMQDLTATMCANHASDAALVVKDKRDEQNYTVRYINGNCWMTSNLRFGYNASNPNTTTLTLNSTTSNVASSYTTASPLSITTYDLVTYGGNSYCYGTYDSSTQTGTGDSYTYPCIHSGVDNNNSLTVWYNYALTSAKTITGTSNASEVSYSLCPAGWRLPTIDEDSGIISYAMQFSPTYGGYYRGGALYNATTWGYWWSSTVDNGARRYVLTYNSGSLVINDYGSSRHAGHFIRCVRSS